MASEPTTDSAVRVEVETQALGYLLARLKRHRSGTPTVDWVYSRAVYRHVDLGITLHHTVITQSLNRLMREGYVERRKLKHGGFEYRATEHALEEGDAYIDRINNPEDV